MKISEILPYAVAFGVGLVAGMLVPKAAPPTSPTASIFVPVSAPAPSVTPNNNGAQYPTRWTSGYHGQMDGIYPEAGVSEDLYPYGEGHKITGLFPSLYNKSGASPGSEANGSVIFVD